MASTRNKNDKEDYKLQQLSYTESRLYNEYEYSQVGRAYTNAIPDIGITPSHMPRSAFSNNSIDIESALFGINSNNLVSPQKPIVPSLKNVPSVAFFNRIPCILPKPLVIEKGQRPFPI